MNNDVFNMSDTIAEEAVLTAVKTQGPISPRRLEAVFVKTAIPAMDARAAVQRLLVRGQLKVDDNLELVAAVEKAAAKNNDVFNMARLMAKRLPRKEVEQIIWETLGVLSHAQQMIDAVYPDHRAVVVGALAVGAPVEIEYKSPRKESRRTILPVALTQSDGGCGVLAWCHLRESMRMFLFKRVVSAQHVRREGLRSPSPALVVEWLMHPANRHILQAVEKAAKKL